MASSVRVGEVRPFPGLVPDKSQALKPLEEAAELFASWQSWDAWGHAGFGCDDGVPREALLDELADCVQACANLAAALGVDDLTEAMARCEARNEERGRYE